MKPPLRYHLTTAAALLAILLCGYGVGFLVGEHVTQDRLGSSGGGAPPSESWEATTLARLTRELDLTPGQQAKAEREINTTAARIAQARAEAVRIYGIELFDLHQRLLPHLDERQRKEIENSRRRLKKMLDSPVPRVDGLDDEEDQ